MVFLIISFHISISLSLSSYVCLCVCLVYLLANACWKIVFLSSFRWRKLKWMFLMVFGSLAFYRIDFIVDFAGIRIVVADNWPAVFVCQRAQYPYHLHIHLFVCFMFCFKVADRNSIRAGIYFKMFRKKMFGIWLKIALPNGWP